MSVCFQSLIFHTLQRLRFLSSRSEGRVLCHRMYIVKDQPRISKGMIAMAGGDLICAVFGSLAMGMIFDNAIFHKGPVQIGPIKRLP